MKRSESISLKESQVLEANLLSRQDQGVNGNPNTDGQDLGSNAFVREMDFGIVIYTTNSDGFTNQEIHLREVDIEKLTGYLNARRCN